MLKKSNQYKHFNLLLKLKHIAFFHNLEYFSSVEWCKLLAVPSLFGMGILCAAVAFLIYKSP